MEDLIGFQKAQIEALQIENEKLKKQLEVAKELLREVVNELENEK